MGQVPARDAYWHPYYIILHSRGRGSLTNDLQVWKCTKATFSDKLFSGPEWKHSGWWFWLPPTISLAFWRSTITYADQGQSKLPTKYLIKLKHFIWSSNILFYLKSLNITKNNLATKLVTISRGNKMYCIVYYFSADIVCLLTNDNITDFKQMYCEA